MKKNGLVWNFLEPQVVETSDHTNKTNKYLYHPNIPPPDYVNFYCISYTNRRKNIV